MSNWITGDTSVSVSVSVFVCHLWSDVGSIILHSHSNFMRQRLKIQTHTHTQNTHTLVKLIKHTREHTLDSCLSASVCVCAASCRLHMASANYFCIIYSGSLTHTHTSRHTGTHTYLPALLLQHFISHLPPSHGPAPSGPLCLLASCAISNHIWAIKI